MADYVLAILPSKLCAATALCSKLIFRFYNNEEHKGGLLTNREFFCRWVVAFNPKAIFRFEFGVFEVNFCKAWLRPARVIRYLC